LQQGAGGIFAFAPEEATVTTERNGMSAPDLNEVNWGAFLPINAIQRLIGWENGNVGNIED
jgi:hypothetical protein